MSVRRTFILLLGAAGTAVFALVSTDAVGLLPEALGSHVPRWVQVVSAWTWKALAGLFVLYGAGSIARRPTKNASTPDAPNRSRNTKDTSLDEVAANERHLDPDRPPHSAPIRRPPIPQPPAAYLAHNCLLGDGLTGRAAERKALTEWFTADDEPVQTIVACGGMGKSCLVWVWLHRDVLGSELVQVPPDTPEVVAACSLAPGACPDGVMWWSFDQLGASFSVFLDEALTYVSRGEIKPQQYLSSPIEKLNSILDRLRQERFLLVLDAFERELGAYADLNAPYQGDRYEEDPRGAHCACASPQAAEFLRRLVAQPIRSRVLLTSRLLPKVLTDPVSGGPVAGCCLRELGGLGTEDAVAFVGDQGVKGNPDKIEAICRTYRGHPLALRLFAGVIRGTRKAGRLRSLRRFAVPRELTGEEHLHLPAVAWRALGRKQRKLLGRIAVIGRPVTPDMLTAITPFKEARRLDQAVNELLSRELLAFEAAPELYELHPTVRWYSYGRLRDKRSVHNLLAERLAEIEPPVQITCIDELQPAIELYHHLIGARRFDEACALMDLRLRRPLHEQFAEYQMLARLLAGLFPDGVEQPPAISGTSDRTWVVDALATAYSYSGQTRRAAAVCEANLAAIGRAGDEGGLAVLLGTLSGVQSRLGRLQVADGCLRSLVAIEGRLQRGPPEAVARSRLGLLLACRGLFEEALSELEVAFEIVQRTEAHEVEPMVLGSFAHRELLMGDPAAALAAARKARAAAEKIARNAESDERDFARSGWLLAMSLIAGVPAGRKGSGKRLAEAHRYLTDALSRCRRQNLVGFEPDLLLVWARWHHLSGRPDDAARVAGEALAIADRCEYRLKQAEAHNFLARLAADQGDGDGARQRARIAAKRAWCDGPPYAYQPAIDEAEKLLVELGGTLPQTAA